MRVPAERRRNALRGIVVVQRREAHPRGTARLHLDDPRHEHDLEEAPVQAQAGHCGGLPLPREGRQGRVNQRKPPNLE